MRTAEKDGRTRWHNGIQTSLPQQKRTEVSGDRRNVVDGLNEFVKVEEIGESRGKEERSNDTWLMPRTIRKDVKKQKRICRLAKPGPLHQKRRPRRHLISPTAYATAPRPRSLHRWLRGRVHESTTQCWGIKSKCPKYSGSSRMS